MDIIFILLLVSIVLATGILLQKSFVEPLSSGTTYPIKTKLLSYSPYPAKNPANKFVCLNKEGIMEPVDVNNKDFSNCSTVSLEMYAQEGTALFNIYHHDMNKYLREIPSAKNAAKNDPLHEFGTIEWTSVQKDATGFAFSVPSPCGTIKMISEMQGYALTYYPQSNAFEFLDGNETKHKLMVYPATKEPNRDSAQLFFPRLEGTKKDNLLQNFIGCTYS